MKTPPHGIEDAIEAEDWRTARRLLEEQLKREPKSHWLLTRLSTTYYEERKYEKALEFAEAAISLAPRCPLAQWDYAGAAHMLGRTEEAIRVWKRLLRRGQWRLDQDPCSEGPDWCASLLNDCRYRLALAYAGLGQTDAAVRSLRGYLAGLDAGTDSIYDRHEAVARLSSLLNADPFA